MARVAVIGAGMGGLAAAIHLAAAGYSVDLFEKEATVGGKLRTVAVGGAQIDCGPTVFTLRPVFERLFAAAGITLDAYLQLTPLPILARHQWQDGSILDLYADRRASAEAIARFAGKDDAHGYQQFCMDAAQQYRVLQPSVLEAQKPSLLGLAWRLGIGGLGAIHPFRRLSSRLHHYFRDPRLLQLFARYATYVGASPYAAPATLMLIAHVEQEGVWSIAGGMAALAAALQRLALDCGVALHLQTPVARIALKGGHVSAIILEDGTRMAVDAVVFNGDVSALHQGLLGPHLTGAVRGWPRRARSLSALTLAMAAAADGFDLSHHNVFFSRDYRGEFAALMQHRRWPDDPTLYVCAPAQAAAGPRPLFVIANAPADGEHPLHPEEIAQCRMRIRQRLEQAGLRLHPLQESLTTPADFHRLFPGSGGALYGRAPHGPFAIFSRPGARSTIPGLYLAGGSVHPGAGLPMAALSGQLAAAALCADLASTRRSHQVAMSGGISMRSATMDKPR